jgi:hypothetical protein
MIDEEACREFIKSSAAKLGADVVVSTAPPLIESPYDVNAFECPHGTVFYIEPTSEQMADWAERQVP